MIYKDEIQKNLKRWNIKPLLRQIYKNFHKIIAKSVYSHPDKMVVELGSGVPDIREVIPDCIRTDIEYRQDLDRIENAYKMTFENSSISTLILFDVFHHLQYPGDAFKEFHRVVSLKGRVIIFEPILSLSGLLVYGLLHKEPIGIFNSIEWECKDKSVLENPDYYAAQGNATRIFPDQKNKIQNYGWKIIEIKRLSSISYILSGGYSMPQLYPTKALPIMLFVDKIMDCFPWIFGHRAVIVLEKTI